MLDEVDGAPVAENRSLMGAELAHPDDEHDRQDERYPGSG